MIPTAIAAKVERILGAAEIDFEGMAIHERSVEFQVFGWGDIKRRRAYDVIKQAGLSVALNGASSVVVWTDD